MARGVRKNWPLFKAKLLGFAIVIAAGVLMVVGAATIITKLWAIGNELKGQPARVAETRERLVFDGELGESIVPMDCSELSDGRYQAVKVIDNPPAALVVRFLDGSKIYNFVANLHPELLVRDTGGEYLEFRVPGPNCAETD